MKLNFKTILPHLAALLIFLIITVGYFSPVVMGGKQIRQSDVTNFKGMSKEIIDYRKEHHDEPLWTNRMFGGMPAFQISTLYPNNYTAYVFKIFTFGLPHPVYAIVIAMLCFYLLLMVLRVDPWVAVFGAIAYGLTSFIFIVIDAGHNPQALAIAFMPSVFAGFIHVLCNKKFLTGAALTALALSLELYVNHIQITYYLAMFCIIYVLAEFIAAIIKKELKTFLKATVFLALACALAVGANAGNLLTTADYGKYTTRGTSDLTIDETGKSNAADKTTGLDRSYATAWSYGIGETFTLLIPNYKGGSSSEPIGKYPSALGAISEESHRESIAKSPCYFGDQPFTSGPVYVGAAIVFLFVFALFIVEGTLKWALLAATVLSIMLSWGHHYSGLTNFFFDHVPGYNKFRSVSFILVIAELSMPLLAVLAVNKIINTPGIIKQKFLRGKIDYMRVFVIALALTGGFALFTYISPSTFNHYFGKEESDYFEKAAQDPKQSSAVETYMNELQVAREQIVKSDALRSFLFIALAAAGLFFYTKKTIPRFALAGSLALLVAIDMIAVDRRYVNSDSFEKKKKEADNPFAEQGRPGKADNIILQDKTPDFRVLNLETRLDQDAATSYFHNSLGGYHGAKLKRYQELIDFHLSRSFGILRQLTQQSGPADSALSIVLSKQNAVNMLNTKYIIYDVNEPPILNPYALGNAWFVENYRIVPSADSEIVQLGKINPARTVLVDQQFKKILPPSLRPDPSAGIKLTSYQPNHLTYHSKTSSEQIAVFSEIYYPSGWNAYIDGKKTDYFRGNYVLRAMMVPAGEHTVEFKFEPSYYYNSEKISLVCSLLVIFGSISIFIYQLRKQQAA